MASRCRVVGIAMRGVLKCFPCCTSAPMWFGALNAARDASPSANISANACADYPVARGPCANPGLPLVNPAQILNAVRKFGRFFIFRKASAARVRPGIPPAGRARFIQDCTWPSAVLPRPRAGRAQFITGLSRAERVSSRAARGPSAFHLRLHTGRARFVSGRMRTEHGLF